MIRQLINLVKIAKQKLDTQERLLLRNQSRIIEKRANIDAINASIAAVPMPSCGSFSAYQSQKASIQAYLYEIEEIQAQIGILRQEQEYIKNEIRKAHLEHEKMLHLYNQAKDFQQAEEMKMETKHLDEITLLLHTRRKNNIN